MTDGLPVASGRQTIRALQRLGFEQVSQRGSHVKLRNEAGRTNDDAEVIAFPEPMFYLRFGRWAVLGSNQ